MSPADLGTARAYGERFATYVATGKTPSTPYRDFTFDKREKTS
jgi:NAD(P)H dehydrogenase (quinone)